jgi:hypothetical protein
METTSSGVVDIRPIPDPTALTTEQLRREIAAVTEIFRAQLELANTNTVASRRIIETRLDAMDKATIEFTANLNRVPTSLDREIDKLNKLFAEKFMSVDIQVQAAKEGVANQFKERDTRTEQLSLADKTAIVAALQAQKEAAGAQNISNAAAITKSEAGFTKEIDGIKLLLVSNKDALNAQIVDLIARLNRSEAAVSNTREVRTDSRLNIGSIVGLLGGVVGVIALVMTIIMAGVTLSNSHNAQSYAPPAQVQLPATTLTIPVPR